MFGDLVLLAVGGEFLSIEIAEDDVVDVGVVLEEGDERAGEGANATHANSNSHIAPLTRFGPELVLLVDLDPVGPHLHQQWLAVFTVNSQAGGLTRHVAVDAVGCGFSVVHGGGAAMTV